MVMADVCRASDNVPRGSETDINDERMVACGSRMPSCRQNAEAHAPPASTAIVVRIVPCSITTPLTRPPAV
ncbi:hypothetical protein [Cupriavidus necator]|uniref:hypothetical protein n=1 Tax=Cupriavidus necator TaxID=106590 RepID=UPI00339D6EE3